jgi:hypothetical protein
VSSQQEAHGGSDITTRRVGAVGSPKVCAYPVCLQALALHLYAQAGRTGGRVRAHLLY